MSDRAAGACVTLIVVLFYATTLLGDGAAASVAPLAFLSLLLLSTALSLLFFTPISTRVLGNGSREAAGHFLKMVAMFIVLTLISLAMASIAMPRATDSISSSGIGQNSVSTL